jgi:hypothetical protein
MLEEDGALRRDRVLGPRLTAFFTIDTIFISSAAVNSVRAKAVGHMAPSSRFALSLKPNVAYFVLNFCALWKKQTTWPSLACAGVPQKKKGDSSFQDQSSLNPAALSRSPAPRTSASVLCLDLPPELFVGDAATRSKALPSSFQDRLQFRGVAHQQALQLVVVGPEQHRDRLAFARYDNWGRSWLPSRIPQSRRRVHSGLRLSQCNLLAGNQQPVAFLHADGLDLNHSALLIDPVELTETVSPTAT